MDDIDCTMSDVENFFCAYYRTQIRGDVFLHGQDLYVIKNRRPMVKLFGKDTWQPLAEVRHRQRRDARCALQAYRREVDTPKDD